MIDANSKSSKTPKPNTEEGMDINETDDISQFIRKIQLQSQVLKKLSENLEHSIDKEKDNKQGKIIQKKK